MTAAVLTEQTAHGLLNDPFYARLKDHVIRLTGLGYYADRDVDLANRLRRRLDALQIDDCMIYLRLLECDRSEQNRLVGELTIGETYFFRHPQMFCALRDFVFPELIARNQSCQRLSIWSAGCSNGAEPYSVAIVLRRDLRHLTRDWDINIVATDINQQYLAQAAHGEFEQWAFRSAGRDLKDSCFVPADGRWRIRKEFSDCVTFQPHNLVRDPSADIARGQGPFDLILCRNVIIYFSKQVAQQTIDNFFHSLAPYGWLCVGHSEPNPELFARYRAVPFDGAVLHQRTGTASRSQETGG